MRLTATDEVQEGPNTRLTTANGQLTPAVGKGASDNDSSPLSPLGVLVLPEALTHKHTTARHDQR